MILVGQSSPYFAFLRRYHQAVEHAPWVDDSRVQVQEAAWIHWFFSNTQQSPSRAEDGWADGK